MKVEPIKYGASYKSNTNMAANTPDTVFSAAANVRGAVVHLASINTFSASNTHGALLAKNSAPANVTDGDAILGAGGPNNIVYRADLPREVFIPAGKGLYYISTALEAGCYRSVLYTLL